MGPIQGRRAMAAGKRWLGGLSEGASLAEALAMVSHSPPAPGTARDSTETTETKKFKTGAFEANAFETLTVHRFSSTVLGSLFSVLVFSLGPRGKAPAPAPALAAQGRRAAITKDL